MKKYTLSIESCVRYFEEGLKRNDFLTFQVMLPKKATKNKIAIFKVQGVSLNTVDTILSQDFKISDKYITFFNSHEDPIIEDDNFIYLSLHVPTEIILEKFTSLIISITGLEEFDFTHEIQDINFKAFNAPLNSRIDIEDSIIFTDKDSILTLHLGNRDGIYTEEIFSLSGGDYFNFSTYINKYAYIGVQCSYEQNFPELEEKHIIKGQKGIFETAILFDEVGNKIAEGLLPYNPHFLNKYNLNSHNTYRFNEVKNIDELLKFHQRHPIQYFESSFNFLKEQYLNRNTYSQARLFTVTKKHKPSHILLDICKKCTNNTECLQVIPSGLSYELMRENISKELSYDCRIFKIIEIQKIKRK